MTRLRQIRKSIDSNKTRLSDIVIGLILGVVIIPIATLLLRLYAKLPESILTALCLVQSIVILILVIWIVFVRDRLRSREAFIHENHPGVDVDSEEEYKEAFKEAIEDHKRE